MHSTETDIRNGRMQSGLLEVSVPYRCCRTFGFDPLSVARAATGPGVHGTQTYQSSVVDVVTVKRHTELSVVKFPKLVRSGGAMRLLAADQNENNSAGDIASDCFLPISALTALRLAPRTRDGPVPVLFFFDRGIAVAYVRAGTAHPSSVLSQDPTDTKCVIPNLIGAYFGV